MSKLEHIGSILTRVLEDIDNASTGVSGILKPNGAKEGIMDARMARKGEVFVLNTGSSAYKRVKEQRAIKEGMDIIMCSRCNAKPVKYLDHLFPYHWEMNYCEDCFWGGDYENIR